MKLERALKILEIEKYLEEKKKDASKYVTRGLFESCNELNEAIKVIKEFLNDNKKV